MTAGGFNQRLTGGGEAAPLIDYRQRLCIQGCCCCCGLQHAALIWWRTLSVSYVPSFFIHLFFIPLGSPSFLFHAAPLLSSSFHSANHSFPPSPSLPSFLSSSSTYSTMRDLSQALKTDGWWWMVRRTRALPLCLILSLFPPFLFTWSWLCFLWCAFEANENTPMGRRRCFQMIRAKSYFLIHRTSIEQSQSDPNSVGIEKRRKKKKCYTQMSVKNPLVENQWGAVAYLLECPPL